MAEYDILDLIKIPGVVGTKPAGMDDALFESLHASRLALALDDEENGLRITLGGVDGQPIPVEIKASTDDVALAPASSWEAQTALIGKQTDVLTNLSDSLSVKLRKLPPQGGIVDFLLQEYKDHLDESLRDGLVSYLYNPIAGSIAEFLVCVAGEAVEYLKGYYQTGIDTCALMIAENQAMSNWPGVKDQQVITDQGDEELVKVHTGDQFDRRDLILSRHEQAIRDLLDIVNEQEETISQPGEVLNSTWKEWLKDMEANLDTMQEWLTDTETEFDDFVEQQEQAQQDTTTPPPEPATFELPVPIEPGLPPAPPSAHPIVVFIYYLLKYGRLIYKIIELINKIRGKNNDAQNEKFLQALQDLQFNEVEFKIPNSNMKVNLFGRSIRYGGKA